MRNPQNALTAFWGAAFTTPTSGDPRQGQTLKNCAHRTSALQDTHSKAPQPPDTGAP